MIVKSLGHTPTVPLGIEDGAGHELGNWAVARLTKSPKLKISLIFVVVSSIYWRVFEDRKSKRVT